MLPLATVLTLAALAVEAQPLNSPWWTYADADATYTASGLNLMLGEEVKFVDHPGLPITEVVAVAAGIDTAFEEGSLSRDARVRYVDRTLLDLDSARWLFRGFAVVFYLLGALLAFVLAARLFGHWTWGFANGLLWLAAPGLIAMSIQLRPDVLLAALCLVFAFAIARAVERRSVGWYAAAAVVAGFATMVKLHALALLLPLLVAAIWRPPRGRRAPCGTGPSADLRARASRRRRVDRRAVDRARRGPELGPVPVQPWLVTARRDALRARRRGRGRRACEGRHRTSTSMPLLVVSFIGGLFIPVTLDLQEGTRALLYIVRNMSGRGVQEGIDPFSTPLSALDGIVGTPIVFVFLLALVAGIVGVVRREPVPVVWAVAALATGVFAYARPPNVHYFAPAFVFSALALLWLLQREPRARMPLLAWVLVLYVVWPAWDNRLNSTAEQERFAATVASAKSYVDAQLAPNEVALVPSYWPFADSRYFELVQIYVAHSPDYPYRYLPATAAVRSYEQPRQMRPRFYIGPLASDLTAGKQVELGDLGRYTIVPREGLVAEIVAGPGVTEPW